jgi:hypothetical protein
MINPKLTSCFAKRCTESNSHQIADVLARRTIEESHRVGARSRVIGAPRRTTTNRTEYRDVFLFSGIRYLAGTACAYGPGLHNVRTTAGCAPVATKLPKKTVISDIRQTGTRPKTYFWAIQLWKFDREESRA